MQLSERQSITGPAGASIALRASLVAILFAEVGVISVRVEGDTIRGLWPGSDGLTGSLIAAWRATAAVVVILATLSLRGRSGLPPTSAPRLREASPWLAAHAASIAAFVATAESGFGERLASPAALVGWLSLGLFAVLSLFAAGWPVAGWPAAARRDAGRLSLLGLVGLATLGLGRATGELWCPLAGATFAAASLLLRVAFPEVVSRPDELVLGTPSFTARIEPGCSGFEGIGLILILIGAYLVAFRRDLRFPRALILLPIGVVLIWVANALRIAGLIAIGTWVSPAVAVGGFHSQAGWISFNAIGLGLILASRAVPWFRVGEQRVGLSVSPTVAYLGPLAAISATAMLTGAFTSGFDRLYPARIVAAGLVLWACRGRYGEVRPTWSWGAFGIGLAVFAGWVALATGRGHSATTGTIAAGLGTLPPWEAGAWLATRLLGYVVIVPVVEELAFRGYLIRRVGSSDFTARSPGRFSLAGLIVSSGLFGLLHASPVAGAVAGLAYAFALRRRGEIGDAIVAHATINGLLAALVLVTGDWSYWG